MFFTGYRTSNDVWSVSQANILPVASTHSCLVLSPTLKQVKCFLGPRVQAAWTPAEILYKDSNKRKKVLCFPHWGPSITTICFFIRYFKHCTQHLNCKQTVNCLSLLTVYIKEKTLNINHSPDSLSSLNL